MFLGQARLESQQHCMKPKRAKTIQIFLPSGDPLGIREAQITTDLMRVTEVPRTAEHLAEFFVMPESQGSASVASTLARPLT